MTSVNDLIQQVKASTLDLKPLEITKTSIGGPSQYTKTSPVSVGSYGTELFSKKKQKFPVHRVYASDIPANITNNQIKQKFSQFGAITEIEDAEINEIENYKSVFVTFQNTEDALDAISSKYASIVFGSNPVKICEAVPKKSQIFVGGLKPETDEEDLTAFFGTFGNVCESVLKTDNRTGLSRCFAFVTFVDSSKVVKKLLKDRFIEMHGKKIEIKPAVPMNQQTRMKRAQMAAAYSVATNEVNSMQRLAGRGKSMSMSMSLESPVFNNANTMAHPATMSSAPAPTIHIPSHQHQLNSFNGYAHANSPATYGAQNPLNPYAAYQATQATHPSTHFPRYGY